MPVISDKTLTVGITVGGITAATLVVAAIVLSSVRLKSLGSIADINVCSAGDRTPLYILLNITDGYSFVSKSTSGVNAMLQNGGDPVVMLCTSAGNGKTPLFMYINLDDRMNITWGSSTTPDKGYSIGNRGYPLGYLFSSSSVNGQALVPVIEYMAEFNDGFSKLSVLGGDNTPTYNGITYSYKRLLGYSVPL